MPKLYSERLSKMRGIDVVVTPQGEETLEQAEERVIATHPDKFGGQKNLASKLANAQGQGATFESQRNRLSEIDNLINQIQSALINTGDKRQSDLFKAKLDSLREERKRYQTAEIDPAKRGVVEALKPQLARLKEIETTSPLAAKLNYAVQNIGKWLNLNPELQAYEEAQEGLKIPVLRGLLGEKGSTQQQEQEAAKRIAFPTGSGLYAQNVRPELLNNVFDTVLGTSGVDLRKELGDEFLKDIGARVGGEVTGPRVDVMQGMQQVGGTLADAIRDLIGTRKKKGGSPGLSIKEQAELEALERQGY